MSRNVESIFGAVVTAPHQIPYTYTATGGETFISLPFYPITGVITINGGVQVPVDNYEIVDNSVSLGRALEAGDVVYCLFDKILSPEDYSNGIRVFKFVAVGNETSFTPDFTTYGIQDLYIDREYKIAGVDYFYTASDGKVTLAAPPNAGVWVVAEMSVKQPNISPLFDRTVQEVGRSANTKDSNVIKSTDTISVLDTKTVIYDTVAQKSWGKPASVPAGAKIVSVTGSTLVYNPGGVSVTLIPVPGSAEELKTKLVSDTGSDAVHYKQAIASAIERSLTSHLFEQVSVKDFGAKGDWDPIAQTGTDDSLAFRAAVKTVAGELGRNVYVPPGNYLVTRAEMSSNVRLFGAGVSSTIYQDETIVGATAVVGTNFDGAGSADWSLNTVNVAIDNLRIKRQNRNTYVSSGDVWQHYHLIYIGATTKFSITNCTLEGFNGDGIYIAGGFGASIERHNLDGIIFNCQFTGVDNQNRNGISVIDCEGLIIANNVFRSCTNQYQPGPIDIESNPYVFHRIRDIKIVGNRFVLCRGVSAGLNVYFPDVAYTSQPLGILFAENEVDGGSTTNTCVGILAVFEGDASAVRNVNMRVINNRFTRCLRGFNVTGMRNIRIEDNEFTEMRGEALLGFGAAGKKNTNVTIKNNLFYNVGYEDGRGLGIYDIDGLIIDGNTFRDVGKGTDPRAGEAIIFKSGRTGVKINITDNIFINEGRLVTAAISSAGYTFDASTNTFSNNTFLGGITAWTFPAVFGNNAEYTWTPVVYGDTTDGVGTYTLQKGSYHIEGGVVHFRMQCTLTAHTGSGPMNLTLPTKAAINGVNQIALGYIVGNIASVSGLSACRIDGALKGAVGRIRIYRYDASGNINISSAGTSLSVEISGTYPYQP